jgi:chemotaxis protein methyltransferase CheR
MPAPIAMTREEHQLLDELITDRFGVSFPEHRREILESRLRPRLSALHLKRYIDYYLQLQVDANGERSRLSSLVTNHESFFFRETEQFSALFGEALPELTRSAFGRRAVRLLSAGCAAGEEPYTIGLFARQSLLGLCGREVTVDAFDLDPGSVAAARQAEYGPGALRSLTPEQVARYFTATGERRWSLRPPLRQGVRFATGNIVDLATFAPAEPYDAVFCRNVLIYFSEQALHRAVESFAAVLRPGGLLFLGAAESILGLSGKFEAVRLANLIAYRKLGR